MAISRQLAAIMFTDIVGYTATMGSDEQKAFKLLKLNRELQKPIIEQYNGRWVKELGDGVLAYFNTVSEAVSAAIDIQEACIVSKEFLLRIGIHQGEIVLEHDDIFGDAVNIASRIQSIAIPGGIYVSESVHNNVSNKKDFKTRFVRIESLKNVRETVPVYEILLSSSKEPLNGSPSAIKKIPEKSIAVLPFVNMSHDPEQEYFSDGMAEEILNSLANIKDLKVAGRTSSFQFKGKNIDLREIGSQLGVSTVLEGSIRKQGNKIRITAQLINVEDGYDMWSEKYDRDMDDIFAIQDEIAMAITRKLKITLLQKEKDFLHKNPTENKEAYEFYLKGRFFWNKRGPLLKKGLEYFQQAVKLDPSFAVAYSGIADSYALLSLYCLLAPHDAMPKSREAAEKAIVLDPTLVEPYASLAFVFAFYDWDWEKAKKQFHLSISINPTYATAHYWYSFYLSTVENQTDQAVQETLLAIELEPISWIPYNLYGVALVLGGRYQDAIPVLEKSIELNPNGFLPLRHLGAAYMGLGKYTEAVEVLTTSAELPGRHQWALWDLCVAHIKVGNLETAQQIYNELLSRSETEYISGFIFFSCSYHLGNIDLAYTFLQSALQQRDANLLFARNWPSMSVINNDPVFIAAMQEIKCDSAW